MCPTVICNRKRGDTSTAYPCRDIFFLYLSIAGEKRVISCGGREPHRSKTPYRCELSYKYDETWSLQLVCIPGLTRPLCYGQPKTLTQGYHPRVDSMAINAAPRRREQLLR